MRHPFFSFDAEERAFELLEPAREPETNAPPAIGSRIPRSLDAAKRLLTETFGGKQNADLNLRAFSIGGAIDALAVSLCGMADAKRIDEFIILPAQQAGARQKPAPNEEALLASVFALSEGEIEDDYRRCVSAVTEGRTAVLLAGRGRALLFDTRGFVSRAVGVSENEPAVLGPHEAFTENLRTNITLLRRILRTPRLVASLRPAGGRNGTQLALLWIDGLTSPALLGEVERRLASVDTAALLSIGTLEQAIEDTPWLPLPQTLKTERPDRAAAGIAAGRVAVLLEGSPIALVLPVTLGLLFASAEDAPARRPVGTLLRLVRAVGVVLSVWMPAYFLALTEHHAGQLSAEVLSVVQSSHVMVLLPLPVETVFLLLVFQLVREAGVRAPGVVGHAIGIIGGLLLGQAAVTAHLVSTVALIVVALSGLGNFTIPDYSTQVCVAYYRVFLCIAAALGGFFGIGTLSLCALAALCHQKSFGVPMLAPLAPKANGVRPFLVRGRAAHTRTPDDALNAEGRL